MSPIVDSFSIKATKSINMMEKMLTNEKIRSGRHKLKLTEQQFADRLDVSRGTVQQWEKEGGTAPARKRQASVAKLLGLSVADLMHETSETAKDSERPGVQNTPAASAAGIAKLFPAPSVSPVVGLALALRAFDTAARERAAVLLQGLARDPDGPWAAWLRELLADPPEQQESLPEPQEAAQGITPFKYTKIVQSAAPLRRKKH